MRHDLGILFALNAANKNSIAVLAGLAENDPRLEGVQILFWRSDHPEPPPVQVSQTHRWIAAFSFCTPGRNHAAQALAQAKAALQGREVLFIAGGPHPSGAPADALDLGFDLVVVGEAEVVWCDLVVRFRQREGWETLPGIAYREGNSLKRTGPAPQVLALDPYPPFAPKHRLFTPIEIMRGCPFGCLFCQTTYLFGKRPRYRSPESVIHWVRIAHHHGIPFARFVAPNLLAYGSPDGHSANLAALESLLRGVGAIVGSERTYAGSFPSEVRPEMVTDEAVALIRRLAGNRTLTIGAQSGSDRLLQALRRGHTVEDVYHACEIALRHGMLPIVDVIFGLPGETAQDRAATLKLVESLSTRGAHIRSHAFIPLAGTPLAFAPPGAIDPETDRILGKLAQRGQQQGARRALRYQ